jgi:trans-2,3-dihydro-3-hydroxyanthranilate isomerase
MAERRTRIYDVFTSRPGEGNPLAVVFEADGLDQTRMQRIARDFGLSETIFLMRPSNPVHSACVRIFTPAHELPFAGHPTVGAAVALFEERARNDAMMLVLEETVGPVRCAVTRDREGVFAEFDLPRLPERLPLAADSGAIAAALGLGPHELGFENHHVSVWSAGVPYVLVPVRGLAAAAKAKADPTLWARLAPTVGGIVAEAYVYCRETEGHANHFHARMFGASSGIAEDPATGSAVAALAGQIAEADALLEGEHALAIEQGVEMGRPSLIRLSLDVERGRIAAARIGGHAVRVKEGTLSG